MKILKKILIKTAKLINYISSGLSMRLVKWTGKAPQAIHPKHLIDDNPEYAKYFGKEDIVLDIGCHNGQRDFKLIPHVKKIVAFDYNSRFLNQAKEWQKKYEIKNIEFMELSAENPLPFKTSEFDGILFLDVLEHIYNRDQLLEECHRVLKPGGIMVLAIPNSETPWKKFQKSAGVNFYSDPDHKIEYSRDEILNELKKFGFKVTEVNPIVYDFPLNGIIDILGGISLFLYGKLSDWKKGKSLKEPEKTIGFLIISKK
jgi:SAM-dependent methyltransferase